jgi:hypothetical protein
MSLVMRPVRLDPNAADGIILTVPQRRLARYN